MRTAPGMGRIAGTAAFRGAVLFVCLFGAAGGNAAVSEACGRRVVRADEILQSGAMRLSDVMLLVESWAPTTIDGFTWQSSPNGLDPHQTASWAVMLDGVRIDAGVFGVTALNALPVHVGDIDSVEVIEFPRAHHGEFAGGGLVHIHTRRAKPGYDVGAAASTGNEAGDPGPWAYTASATPNVDRIGPRYALRGSYGSETASAAASWLSDRHYATDAAVRERTFGIAGGSYPQMSLAAGSGRVDARAFGGRHRLSASYSRFDDFFFFKPYGREIPVVNRLSTGSLDGSIPIGEAAVLDYRASRTSRAIGYRPNTPGLDFDWKTRTWLGGADLSLETASLRHRYGVVYEGVEAVTAYALSRPRYDLFTLRADWEWPARGEPSYRFGAALTDGEGDLSVGGSAAGRWRFGRSNRVEAIASYGERRPERDGRIWYWHERGYGFLPDAGVSVTQEGPLEAARRWTADLEWTSEMARVVSGGVRGYYRGFADLLLEEQAFVYDPAEHAFGGPVRLVTGQEGDVAGVEAVADAHLSRRIRLRTAYRYERTVAGDDLFRRVWDAVPDHVFAQTVVLTPTPSLSLWGRLVWMSETRWHDYDGADAKTAGAYRSTLDDVLALDVALTKCFWDRRLKGYLSVRNLLGTAPLYHPIGASFDTTVYAGIDLAIGGGDAGSAGNDRKAGGAADVLRGHGGEEIDSARGIR